MSDIPKLECNLPAFQKEAFHCPHCHVYVAQSWFGPHSYSPYSLWASCCVQCKKCCVWVNKKMMSPDTGNAPQPNNDMSGDVKKIYGEAAQILSKSPRATAGLLRLALEELCSKQLKCKGKNMQEYIDFLIKEKGLSGEVTKAMDAVRIIGNKAVHAGTIDLGDDTNVAKSLFALINYIAKELITLPKEREKIYSTLPKSKKRKDMQ